MKKFTVKDFITYGGPCFSCGRKVVVKLQHVEDNEIKDLPYQKIEKGVLDATLRIKYSSNLALRIFINTNKFQISDMEKFITYLGINELLFTSNCKACQNLIMSNELQFDSRGFLRPLTLKRELLQTKENNIFYSLMTEFSEEETQINVLNQNTGKMMKMTIPMIPLYKWKTKEKLIQKLKTYILFS